MSLQLGDVVPDFTQDSSEGTLSFHEWAGDSWVVLFSHPADYTPVCTTELGTVANLKPEFDKRNVKVLALSVDNADSIGAGLAILTKPKIPRLTTPLWRIPIARWRICTV